MEPLVVRFRTRAPDLSPEHRLASWCGRIINKRAYEERGFDGFSRDPVGIGSFKFRTLQADQRIIPDALDDYWTGKPTARSVEFRQIPELASCVAALQAGDVDLITNIPPDQVSQIRLRLSRVWTTPAYQGLFVCCADRGCGHVFGLLRGDMEPRWP